jgi:hypothetical protein
VVRTGVMRLATLTLTTNQERKTYLQILCTQAFKADDCYEQLSMVAESEG